MTDAVDPLIAAEEVRKNFIRSFILIGILVALVFGAGYLIGYLLEDIGTGMLIAAIVVCIVLPIQILTAKFAILSMTHGRKVDTDNFQERRLLQIVEGIAVSAGLQKTPDVYIIPSDVPNAFASGLNESNAFICVTQGLLDMMNESELEGVIGHETGHIIHRDIMLNQLVVALISALLILAFILERLGIMSLLSGGNDRRRNNRSRNSGGGGEGVLILVVVLLALLVRPLAYLLGSLLQMAISRQREFAADAASIRLCSYNDGLASALEKLSGKKEYDKEDVNSLGGGNMSAMYIYYPSASELFSTHPDTQERIRRIRNMY